MLDVAEDLIERNGLLSFRFSDIAKQAGCSSGTVYKFFESKEDLFLCLFLRSAAANNIPSFIDEYTDLDAVDKILLPILVTFETVQYSKSFSILRSVAVNSKVWHLASTEKAGKFKRRANLFYQVIERSIKEANANGELIEDEQQVQLLIDMLYFQLYGLCTSYESELISSFNEDNRKQVERDSILKLINSFSWRNIITCEKFDACRLIVEQHFRNRQVTKLSCAQCHRLSTAETIVKV
ncbi:TetR/AcrR family transcriptional regulator [Shewanella sp. 0m-11]